MIADYLLSIIMGMCRVNCGGTLNPVAVNLRRPEPKNQKPYLDFFGCDVRFDAGENGFVLGSRVVDMPLPSGNHELAVTFDTILAGQMAALGAGDITTRCKDYLLKQLTSGEPSEQALANALGMSLRSLQRKLGELGTTYKRLLDETRYDLALKYLDDPKRSITEITFLLGFSEQSAFTRAFKRWSEKSPTTYRAGIAANPDSSPESIIIETK
jgi:AraC-like DNA-binding protein